MTGKVSCLNCSEGMSILKEYSIGSHENSRHKGKYKSFFGAVKRQKLAALKRRLLESQQNVFRNKSHDISSALRASYHVAHLLAKEGKYFSDGGICKKMSAKQCKGIYPEKETAFNTVSLSHATVAQRVEDISSDLSQIRQKVKRI
jgi:hypothetical protein